MSAPLLLLGLAAGLGVAFYKSRAGAPPSSSAPSSPVPLYAGVPYLFLVRLETSEDEARPVLEAKGVENLLFSESSNPPAFAAPGEDYGHVTASFKAVPKGSSAALTLGMPFYGVGRLEQLVRLDGRAFTEAPSA